jgi:hypothetical protein
MNEDEQKEMVTVGVSEGRVFFALGEWEMRLSPAEAVQIADAIVKCAELCGKNGAMH